MLAQKTKFLKEKKTHWAEHKQNMNTDLLLLDCNSYYIAAA